MPEFELGDDWIDAGVDDEIEGCLDLKNPRSFFLFAGAGSGKTRSLTEALRRVLDRSRQHLRVHHQKIAVITYTNAASEEIQSRVQYDPLVKVSTIHSFVWSQIGGFHADIRMWLEEDLKAQILDLVAKEQTGRKGNASIERKRKIESKSRRLENLPKIKAFTYNPNGDNVGQDALNHAEVIAIGSDFLTRKPLMQRVLVNAFPIVLVDESQDTHKAFMASLFDVQAAQSKHFSLGLIGDSMQRIYGHGMAEVDRKIPGDWATPSKTMNHRSPERIVRLINRIRLPVDGRRQKERSDKGGGFVRLFIAQSGAANPDQVEADVKIRMAQIASDNDWLEEKAEGTKALILEHHMAARRLGFSELFAPLYNDSRLQTGLLDGTLPGLKIFSEQVMPVIQARKCNDEFGVASILRKHSNLLSEKFLLATKEEGQQVLGEASKAVNALTDLFENGNEPTFREVLQVINETNMFPIPEPLRLYTNPEMAFLDQEMGSSFTGMEEFLGKPSGWGDFLDARFSQIEPYRDYVQGLEAFDTHQGVKGREFDRVMVIIDDLEARGSLFSFDKLFGTKGKTKTDLENEASGKETGIDRTRRLLYVTCSRAMKSLALVLYSPNPEQARQHSVKEKWFDADEVEVI
ncbi:MAG: UvrD-helicase domain-containing protein [Parvibaculaceae bacterium]|nr:UvrD-helicase domain-containing protein [Parvibaculaceae bacterium]